MTISESRSQDIERFTSPMSTCEKWVKPLRGLSFQIRWKQGVHLLGQVRSLVKDYSLFEDDTIGIIIRNVPSKCVVAPTALCCLLCQLQMFCLKINEIFFKELVYSEWTCMLKIVEMVKKNVAEDVTMFWKEVWLSSNIMCPFLSTTPKLVFNFSVRFYLVQNTNQRIGHIVFPNMDVDPGAQMSCLFQKTIIDM